MSSRPKRKITRTAKTATPVEADQVEETVSQPTKPAAPKVIQIQINYLVSVGEGDERTYEELRDELKGLMQPRVKSVVVTGGYYLVDGRVCMPFDYDPATHDRKPGTHPPLWAGGLDERAVQRRIIAEQAYDNALAKNPPNLRTAKETDAYHRMQRTRTPAEALDDLRQTPAGKRWEEDRQRERSRTTPAPDIDEVHFNPEDLSDSQLMNSLADEEADDAIAELTGKPKPKRRIVRHGGLKRAAAVAKEDDEDFIASAAAALDAESNEDDEEETGPVLRPRRTTGKKILRRRS